MNLEGMVEQIPFGLLAGELWNNLGVRKEVRIIKLAENGLVFRTAEPFEQSKGEAENEAQVTWNLVIHFFDGKENRYQEAVLTEITVEPLKTENKNHFSDARLGFSYFLSVEDEQFQAQTRRLLNEYYRYINLKLGGDDSYLSKECVGYPAEKDEDFATDFNRQKLEWYKSALAQDIDWQNKMELAIELDNPILYQEYLEKEKEIFFKDYWMRNGLKSRPFSKMNWTRIYIGNQFCHNLFPSETQLFSLLQKAKQEGLFVTIAFTYFRETYVEKTTQLLLKLHSWCKEEQFPCEVIVNDWGMAALLKGKVDFLTPVLGILLNKRRKDPRMHYKKGFQADAEYENAVNSAFFQQYLKRQYGMTRYEFESCGYDFVVPEGHHSLHVPYFQTNTSQYCPLFARCVNGDRGAQSFVKACPHYCMDYVFLYPKHLQMVGRYNSLFGYDKRALGDKDFWSDIQKSNMDRIVVNLM